MVSTSDNKARSMFEESKRKWVAFRKRFSRIIEGSAL